MLLRAQKKLQGKPFVIQLLGSTKRKIDQPRATEYFVLMELCTGGNLMDLISRRHKEKLKEPQLASIFYQITVAVSHLHKMKPPIAHRDLKIENVLIGGDGEMRLCDFGSCTSRAQAYLTREEMTQEEERIQKYSTSMYRAPEMVDLYKKEVINEKVDVWALGCILYTLAFFTQPFQEGGNLQIIGGSYHVPEDHKFSKHVITLIKKMLTLSPKKRPDITKVMELNQKWIKALKKEGHTVDIPKIKKAKKAKEEEEDDSDDSEDDDDEGEKKTNGKPSMNTDFEADFDTDFNAHSPTSAAKSSSSLHPSQSFPNAFPASHSTPPSAQSSPAIPPVGRSMSNPAPAAGVFDMSAFADSLVGGATSPPPASAPAQPPPAAARAVSPAHGVRTPSPSLPPPPSSGGARKAHTPTAAAAPAGFDFFGGSAKPAPAPAAAPLSPAAPKPPAAKPANGAVKKAAAPAKKKVEESSSEEESSDDSDSEEDSEEESEEDGDSDDGGKKKKRPPLSKQK